MFKKLADSTGSLGSRSSANIKKDSSLLSEKDELKELRKERDMLKKELSKERASAFEMKTRLDVMTVVRYYLSIS
jgi:hypothetical protein